MTELSNKLESNLDRNYRNKSKLKLAQDLVEAKEAFSREANKKERRVQIMVESL